MSHPSAKILTSEVNTAPSDAYKFNSTLSENIKNVSLDKERDDRRIANQIQIRFLCLKTPTGGTLNIPRRFYFSFRFFTLPDIETDSFKLDVGQTEGGRAAELRPDTAYFLQKSGADKDNRRRRRDRTDELIEILFDIDPSVSRIHNQHIMLAKYLKKRYLTVDIFDADSRFFFGACKIPLYHLLR